MASLGDCDWLTWGRARARRRVRVAAPAPTDSASSSTGTGSPDGAGVGVVSRMGVGVRSRVGVGVVAARALVVSLMAAQVLRSLAKTTTTEDPLHNIVNDSDEDEDNDWNKTLADAKVIPDVIPSGVQFNLKVLFENDHLAYGNILVPFRAKEEPMFVGWPSVRDKYYTIIMTDPDNPEPENPVHAEWIHWIIMDVQDANRTVARRVCPYQGPMQNDFRRLRGMHRYVIAVYEQPHANIQIDETYTDKPPYGDRAHFQSKWFVKKYKLKPACACNFFRVNWLTEETTTKVNKEESRKKTTQSAHIE